MILYFPSVKISRIDIIPKKLGITHLFYMKSQLKSPKHYPQHPLISGKIEFAGKIEFIDDLTFWFNFIFNDVNPKKAKGKIISVLVEFNSDDNTKFILKGIGKKNEIAYLFSNKSFSLLPEENKAKLFFDLSYKNIKEKKKTKV